MQYLSAYALISLTGKQPTIQNLTQVLQATGKPYDSTKIQEVIAVLKGKKIDQIMNQGIQKLGFSSYKQDIKSKRKFQIHDEKYLLALDECGQRAEYHNLVDVLFVVDTTASMSWCIKRLKTTILAIISNFADKQYNIKFALQFYRDHPPQQNTYVQKHYDLMSAQKVINIIEQQCNARGGGDSPQAMFDGLVQGLKKTSWRVSVDKKTQSKRFLFHGCDAPPHGKQYGSNSSDPQWTNNGCPCGLNKQNVLELLKQYNVDYTMIKCGTSLEQTCKIFRQCFGPTLFKREIQIKDGGSYYYEDYDQEQYEQMGGGLFGDDEGYYVPSSKTKGIKKEETLFDMAEEVCQQMQGGLFGFFD